MTTLKEIAKEAGVSVMTVSNVVNGNFSKVSKKNAERIQKIIKEKNYVPNSSARSLAKSNSNIIAIILRGDQNENSLKSPHNASLVGTVIQKIQQHGYYAMVSIVQTQEDIMERIRTWNVAGTIFLGMFDDEIEKICLETKIPKVFIDSYSSANQLFNIGIDDYKGGRLAAQHLMTKGHKKLAFVGPPTIHNGVIQHRFSGFCDELNKNGIELDPRYKYELESDVQPEAIIEIGKRIADEIDHVTAAFVTSDQIASYLIQGLNTKQIRVPEDFSVIGFDNLMISTFMIPQLTTIAQDLEQKASLSVDILFKQLNDPGMSAVSLVLDVNLVERNSVASLTETIK
jgi:LacI family transcriptional regulator